MRHSAACVSPAPRAAAVAGEAACCSGGSLSSTALTRNFQPLVELLGNRSGLEAGSNQSELAPTPLETEANGAFVSFGDESLFIDKLKKRPSRGDVWRSVGGDV